MLLVLFDVVLCSEAQRAEQLMSEMESKGILPNEVRGSKKVPLHCSDIISPLFVVFCLFVPDR
jgi:hypothetical protein